MKACDSAPFGLKARDREDQKATDDSHSRTAHLTRMSHSPTSFSSRPHRLSAIIASLLLIFLVSTLPLLSHSKHPNTPPPYFPASVNATYFQPATDLKKVADKLVLPPIRVGAADRVCALCTSGVVYAYGGEGGGAAAAAVTPRDVTTVVCRDVSPAGGAVLASVEECVARLHHVGLLRAPDAREEAVNASCVRVTVPSIVGHMSGGSSTCPAFLAEMRPVSGGHAQVQVRFPRMPSWPLPGSRALPYVGTAAVRDTDVDRDVAPPVSVELTSDGSAVVLRFGPDETSTVPGAFELRCATYFFSVYIGRFGRQHNQLQEILHGLAFARASNRTYVLPTFVPESYAPYVRYDASKLYGLNAIRREGRYCFVTNDEAKPIFAQLQALGAVLDLRRFDYDGNADAPRSSRRRAQLRELRWWELPPVRNGVREYNLDGWLADSMSSSPPVLSVADHRAAAVLFRESVDEPTVADVFGSHTEAERYGRWDRVQMYAARMLELLGGDHVSDAAGGETAQVRMAVMSGETAFFLHPRLEEATRLFGLLRPSAHVSAEADRVYSKDAAALGWPTDGATVDAGERLVMRDALRPGNFKHVVGIHVRRREGTCRKEATDLGYTNFALRPGTYALDRTDPSWAGGYSTVTSIELDCSWTVGSVVELYRQYAQWLWTNVSHAPGRDRVPTSYVAYDDQSGPMAENLERALQLLRVEPVAKPSNRTVTLHSDRYVASYDGRVDVSFYALFKAARRTAAARVTVLRLSADYGRLLKEALVGILYEPALQEMQAMSFDYIMLTNTEVFRGNVISSVATNVMLRRWGRGLASHGVLAGYQETFYKGVF
ncbi:hypothetical protein JIQ42_08148 [Leishmania sp. Namibia]|uniref:hypothetical protein n=1 Tax=Leishmania sp. Namibia TaxID=2802991 RepID=UPI001B6787A2|nr:hypothetical protein JIQ42_08148 [Leishmania sp. Namibia]